MPYNRSHNAIKKVESYLAAIAMLKDGESMDWANPEPQQLAYLLHNALYVARNTIASPYKDLADKYYIRVKGGRVVVTPKIQSFVPGSPVTFPVKEISNEFLAQTTLRINIEAPETMLEIAESIDKFKAHEMYFPNASVSIEELDKLYTYCTSRRYYMVVGDIEDGLLITKTDPGELAYGFEKASIQTSET